MLAPSLSLCDENGDLFIQSVCRRTWRPRVQIQHMFWQLGGLAIKFRYWCFRRLQHLSYHRDSLDYGTEGKQLACLVVPYEERGTTSWDWICEQFVWASSEVILKPSRSFTLLSAEGAALNAHHWRKVSKCSDLATAASQYEPSKAYKVYKERPSVKKSDC